MPRIKYDQAELESAYAAGGIDGVCQHFGIKKHNAELLCIRRNVHIPRGYQKVQPTEFMDKAIRKAYESNEQQQIQLLAERFKVHPGWIRMRAQILGCTVHKFKKEPKWTPEEDEIVEELQGYSILHIQKRLKYHGFQRSLGGIHCRIAKLKIDKSHTEGYTANELSRLFGVEVHVILRWIKNNGLKANRANFRVALPIAEPTNWMIRPVNIRRFIIENMALIDFHKLAPNKEWFISLLTDRDLWLMESLAKKQHATDSEDEKKPARRRCGLIGRGDT